MSRTEANPPAAATEPILTQENFEKELQALASKAKEETWGKWAKGQAWVLLQSGTLLTLAAIYSNVSRLTLSPVFGGIPASIWHSQGVMTACFMGWSSNLLIRRHLPLRPVQLLPLIAAYIPVMQFFLFKMSSTLGVSYGPILIESVTFLPLLLLSVSCTATMLDDLELNTTGRLQWLSDAGPGIGSYAFFKTMEYLSNNNIQRNIGATFIQTRLGLEIILAGLYAIFAPSKLLLLAIPALLHTALFNIHVQYSYTTSLLNSTLAKSSWSILDRQESNTGYISVLEGSVEDIPQRLRVMRCDHSLLGGEWLMPSKIVADPVYSIFVMLEAVRLIETPEPVPDTQANALIIGLGIGTAPSALIAHGIDTTIVDIDPVVFDFATKYFSLPTNHTTVVADAVAYASNVAQSDQKFDYILHDVFTGGAEPVDLFTLEFLHDLHTMLKPGGVIAINYAADLFLPPSRIIVHTVKAIFPNCRIFREHEQPPASVLEEQQRDFTNMVFFCTKDSEDVRFRKPTSRDYLESRTRQNSLVPKYEIPMSTFEEVESDGGVLRSNGTERFRNWQQQGARGHWAVMRTVLPAGVWENW